MRFVPDPIIRLGYPRPTGLNERAGGGHVGQFGAEIGRTNRGKVRAWLARHLGATNRECAAALGISETAVSRHVAEIRKEWE